jgi:hypothetical protein
MPAGGTGLIFRLEWQRALARPRLFVFNIMIPLLLVLPLMLGAAPPQHAAAVCAVLFVLFGTFGAAIPALRDAERGLLRRLTLTRLSAYALLLGRALAGALLDVVQLLPALLVVALAGHAPLRIAGLLGLALAGSLCFANLLGLWLAAAARSVAEGALFAAVAALLLLHASGVFRTPASGSLAARIEAIAPFRALHETLLASATAARPAGMVALALGLVAALLLSVLAAPWLVRALRRADGH